MGNRYRSLFWIIPAVVLFGAGFALSARWDLQIDQAVYSPQNLLACLFEAFGWLPAFLPIILLGMLWAAEGYHATKKRWRLALGCLVVFVGLAVLYNTCYHYLEKRGLAEGVGDARKWLWLAFGVAVALAAFWWVFRQQKAMRYKLVFFAMTGSVYMVANQVVINILKSIWQRTRFDTMVAAGDGFAAFTPWYLPFGNGGSSFPSAHTANAGGIFVLIILCDLFPAWNRHRVLVYCICWVYVALMGVTRIIIGRHFLSDVLAAAGVMAILLFALRRTKTYKQGLARARSIGKEPPCGEV